MGKGLEVHEAGATDVHAVRLGAAVRDQVAAQLATRRLHGCIRLALGHVEALGEDLEVVDEGFHGLVDAGPRRGRHLLVLYPVVPGWHEVQDLLDDPQRFPDLVLADGVAVERVAVGSDDDIELDLVVGQVGLVPAKVPGVAGGTQDGPGGRQRKGLGWGDDANALQAAPEDRLPGQQRVVLVEARRDQLQEAPHVGLPSVRQVCCNAAGPDVVVVHPETGHLLEEAQHLLAFPPAVDHHGDGAEVHAVGGLEEQVGGDPVQLAHEHPDPGGPCRHLEPQELFDSQGEGKFREQRRRVVHARHVGGAL